MANLSDTLLVSIEFSDKDTGVLVVGRKRKNQSVEIVNAFQGEEALELYKKLVTKKGGKLTWAGYFHSHCLSHG